MIGGAAAARVKPAWSLRAPAPGLLPKLKCGAPPDATPPIDPAPPGAIPAARIGAVGPYCFFVLKVVTRPASVWMPNTVSPPFTTTMSNDRDPSLKLALIDPEPVQSALTV